MPYLQTDKGNINKILNDLEKRELIYRDEKPEDRREKNYIREKTCTMSSDYGRMGI